MLVITHDHYYLDLSHGFPVVSICCKIIHKLISDPYNYAELGMRHTIIPGSMLEL